MRVADLAILTFENCDPVFPQSLCVPSSREPWLESSSTVWCPHAGDEIFYHLLPRVVNIRLVAALWESWWPLDPSHRHLVYSLTEQDLQHIPILPMPLLKPWHATYYTPTQRDFVQSLSFCAFLFLVPSSHFHQPPLPDSQSIHSTDGQYWSFLHARKIFPWTLIESAGMEKG